MWECPRCIATTGERRGESPSPVTKYVSAPLTYAIIRRLHKPIYSATVQKGDGESNVIWSSALSGGSDYSGPDFENAQIIDEGTYANWKWSVRGYRQVERSSRLWSHASASKSEPDALVHDWQSGMRLLYKLSAYLLGEPPRAIDAHVMLIPAGQAYEVHHQRPIASTTQLDFAAAYPVSLRTANSAQAERFDDVRAALARLGGLLQHLSSRRVQVQPPTRSQRVQSRMPPTRFAGTSRSALRLRLIRTSRSLVPKSAARWSISGR